MSTTQRVDLQWDPQTLDQKWQERWDREGAHKVDDDGSSNHYELTMYPYPSGDLHIGHWYAMGLSDARARFKRMQGFNVLHPMGFDAFGLPAENAAIKDGIHPKQYTMGNIEKMRKQLRSIGAVYDWRREIICALPEYYKWNQWLFIKLFNAGLAYRANAPAVWCPSCQTVLANEQVVNDCCERCDEIVTRRDLDQWFLRITDYADQLLDFSGLIDWPDKILTMQRNWIGRSEGVEIGFDISEYDVGQNELRVFTTRIDTIFGVTFMVLAPEHPLVGKLTADEKRPSVEAYIEQARQASEVERLSTEREKTGVFIGAYCVNNVNGDRVPIFIADYALSWYGTGAVMGVPAHDQRDFDFSKKYNLPINVVITGPDYSGQELTEAFIDNGIQVNSGSFDGISNLKAMDGITKYIVDNNWGEKKVSYRMRDWLVSRQRYWGTPIPIIYCDTCGVLPVPESDLPIQLPDEAEFKPTGESPLARHPTFPIAECPKCGKEARRETDTMDTFFDSSWYFLRYTSSKYDDGPWDPAKAKAWCPVDQYTGGAEHAVMHLLYSRFFIKALNDMELVDFQEPFLRLFSQGSILLGGSRMSKSRGNVIAPDKYVKEMGADVVRCYLMFVGPWDQGGEWSDSGLNGIARWLRRVWSLLLRDPNALASETASSSEEKDTNRVLHKTIRKVTADFERFKFNTMIASMMELTNSMSDIWDRGEVSKQTWVQLVEIFLKLLAPAAPHLTEELWEKTGHKNSIHKEMWPKYQETLAAEEVITLVVQVNGKVRDRIQAPPNIDQEEAQRLSLESEKVSRHIAGKGVQKFIYVPGRLLNIVTGPK